jgi:hypothetical protein
MADSLNLGGLGPLSDAAKQKLGQSLLAWKLCGKCTANPSCTQLECPWSQADCCDAFWNLYHRITVAYTPECLGRRPALKSHEELLSMVEKIKSRKTIPRRTVLQEIFEADQANSKKPPTASDQNRVFNIVASLNLLMDLGVLHDAGLMSSRKVTHAFWRDGVSAEGFIREAFPKGPAYALSHVEDMLPALRADKLQKHAKLRFRATDDIRHHLLLDKKEKIVWVFHQMTALRQRVSAADQVTTADLLPKDLMLEVLDTIHLVLFPPLLGPQNLLAHLVRKDDWDKGLLSDVTASYRDNTDAVVSFPYFGNRLKELHIESQSPTPHGWLQKRLVRRGNEYMLTLTMYGVLAAVALGFLTLVTTIFQSWVAWQQWKHPVH